MKAGGPGCEGRSRLGGCPGYHRLEGSWGLGWAARSGNYRWQIAERGKGAGGGGGGGGRGRGRGGMGAMDWTESHQAVTSRAGFCEQLPEGGVSGSRAWGKHIL